MRKLVITLTALSILMLALPLAAMASGDKASELVVVADTRVIPEEGYYHSFMRYMADNYNNNIVVFAIWCTVLTAVYGAFLGFLMDRIMEHTGLDLKSRKIIEH